MAEEIRAGLHAVHTPAASRRAALRLWFAPTTLPRNGAHLLFEQQPEARGAVHLVCAGQVQARTTLHMSYGVQQMQAARAALHLLQVGTRRAARLLRLGYSGTDVVETRTALHARYASPRHVELRAGAHLLHAAAVVAAVIPETVVTVSGVRVRPIAVRIVEDVNQVADTATVEFAQPPPPGAITEGAPVIIHILGITYIFLVEHYARNREFGAHTCTLTASHQAHRLQARYSHPVRGALTGLASALATSLCGTIPLSWRMVDWLVQPLRWQATGEAPLDLLRNLVSAAGGVLTSARDGTLIAMSWPPVSPPGWQGKAKANVDSMSSIYTLADDEDQRDRFNQFTVTDEIPATDQFRIDEDTDKKRGAHTEVLVYQTPWDNAFDVSHRGDTGLVVLQALGVEERVIDEELIEIRGGEGRTQFPIYELIRMRWNKTDLGSIKHSEDGRIETGIDGESLLFLTYRTRARRYKVYMGPGEPEPLMLVAGG